MFRSGPVSKIMIGVLAIGLFAIVATGFGSSGMGGLGALGGLSADTLASVDGEPVTATEISAVVDRQLGAARQETPDLDIATYFGGGAFEGILSELIAAKALTAFGLDQGLAASKKSVDSQIAAIPAFQNLAGQFDDAAFRRLLQTQNLTEQQVRDDFSATMIRQQLLAPLAANARVPGGMALQYASLLLEQRSGSVGIVTFEAMGAGARPTDAEVAGYYRSNQARYTVPEQRVLRFAAFGQENVAAASQPTEAEVQAAYRAGADGYAAKETRTLSQVVLPGEAEAKVLAARVAGGASLDQAAGAGLISVGAQTKQGFTNIASKAVADAAFATARGKTTAPIKSPLGWHIVRVDAVTGTAAKSLFDVRGEIEQGIVARKQAEALAAMVSRIEDKLGEGSSFEEVAKAEKLSIVETPPVTLAGQSSDGNAVPVEARGLLKSGFEMEQDDDPVVETIVADQRYVILAVGRIMPAAAPPLARIKDQVTRDFAVHRASERAKAVASTVVAKINRGMPAARAFAETGLKLPPVQPVLARRLDIARPDQPVPPPLQLMFSMAPGKARLLSSPGGGWFVVHLASVVPGNAGNAPGLVEATRTQFAGILGEEYATQFARAVEADRKVKRNANAIRATKQGILRGRAITP